MYVFAFACLLVYFFVRWCFCLCVNMYVGKYVCIYVYMYAC